MSLLLSRTSETLGEVRQYAKYGQVMEDWWMSNPVPIPFFSGQEIRFVLVDQSLEGPFPTDLESAIQNFLKLGPEMRLEASDRVYQNYTAFLEVADIDELSINEKTDIWNFVKAPEEIFVERRHRRDFAIYLALPCGCEWEEEHGLQLIFKEGKSLTRVSDIDGHLTHSDAYDLPED